MGNGESIASLQNRSVTELRQVDRVQDLRAAEDELWQSTSSRLSLRKSVGKISLLNADADSQTAGDTCGNIPFKQTKSKDYEFKTIKSVPELDNSAKNDSKRAGDTWYWCESSSEFSSGSSETSYPISSSEDDGKSIQKKRSSLVAISSKLCSNHKFIASNWRKGYTPNKRGRMVSDKLYDADDREAMADALDWMKHQRPLTYYNILEGQRGADTWLKTRLAEKRKSEDELPQLPFYTLEHYPELIEDPVTHEENLYNYRKLRERLRRGGEPPETHYWKSFKSGVVKAFTRIKASWTRNPCRNKNCWKFWAKNSSSI